MNKSLIILAIAGIGLSGCASKEYIQYTNTQSAIHVARHNAEAEKYKAMAAIANSGDTTTKVAAMMAIQASNITPVQGQHIAAPKSGWDTFREMVGIILPTAVQGYGIYANKQVSINQSNNSRITSVSTNDTFLQMARTIQSPQPNQTINGNGLVGSGSYTSTVTKDSNNPSAVDSHDTATTTNTDRNDVTTTTGSYNPSTVDNHAVSTTTDNHAVSTTTDDHSVITNP